MKRSLTFLAVVIAAVAGGGYWYVHGKLPQRDGEVTLAALQAPVSVRYDTRGVPHIQAQNETDLYRALGYVHAQDRLFQMEITRRLAKGELAEVLGAKLVETDTLFRSLRIAEQASLMVERQDKQAPAWLAALKPTAATLLQHLSLLFVPAGVGVMLHLQRLGNEALAIGVALVLSTLVGLASAALTMAWLMKRVTPPADHDQA